MSDPYIIAEAAQGFLPLVGETGSADIALLLVKAAATAQADAVKFQVVYVGELAQPGNVHYDIFRRLEMPDAEWRRIREYAMKLGIDFYADIFGQRSLTLARNLGVDGIKVHSTSFFDHNLISGALAVGCPVAFSVGGIEYSEIEAFVERHRLTQRKDVLLLYGFQAEPTPISSNHLARIPVLAVRTGLRVGFMDHSDGAGPDDIRLSVLALGLGVRVFEKHVTLDRALALEDYVSAVAPARLAEYVSTLRRLATALGSGELDLTEAERAYREKALKRTTASRTMNAGARITAKDVELIRPTEPRGAFDPDTVVGRRLRTSISEGQVISPEDIE